MVNFVMTYPVMQRWLAMGVAALFLAACSHTPGVGGIPPGATFKTNILADDTKLFMYSQRFAQDERSDVDSRDGVRSRNQGSGSVSRSAQYAQVSLRGVKAVLAQNHYCRDDYVVLEQYEEHGSYIIRGECRDAATSAERGKFTQH
jgi:hypothetical protein